jgi:hypothetical protein
LPGLTRQSTDFRVKPGDDEAFIGISGTVD